MNEPDWYKALKISDRLREQLLAHFTPHRDGWVRWYNGSTVFVCGKKTSPEQVDVKWAAKKAKLDSPATPAVVTTTPSLITIRTLYGLFIARQRRRMETGRPEPLSPFTLEDYINTLKEFAKIVGADTLVDDLKPADFNRYAQTFDKRAASTLARKIAYVQAMFAWGDDAGICTAPRYGPDFIKPSASTVRDERISVVKRYTGEEVRALWAAATPQEKLWIGLAVNGSFDNSDLANLTADVVDLEAGVIDYRRRKKGKVRRVIPLRPEVVKMFKKYTRPPAVNEADKDLVFLTPTGHKLVRMVASRKNPAKSNPIDYIAFRWSKLLHRSGLRPKPTRTTIDTPDGGRRRKLVWAGGGDRRGFRGLRTTFANAVPPGYSDERKIIMGHSHGTTFLDDYLEKVGMERLREVVEHVWAEFFTDPQPSDPAAGVRRVKGGRGRRGNAVPGAARTQGRGQSHGAGR